MVTKAECDGCGKILKPASLDHAIHGTRAHEVISAGFTASYGWNSDPGQLPEEFDWCRDCADTAFGAVTAVRGIVS